MNTLVFVVTRKLIDRLEIIGVFDVFLDAKNAANDAHGMDDESFYIEVIPFEMNNLCNFDSYMSIFDEPSPCFIAGPDYA